MDNVTHSLFALTLSRTGLRRVGTGTTAALLIASNAPDIDIVAAFSPSQGAYLAAHRSLTHGPIGVILIAALTAFVVRWWPLARGRQTTAEGESSWTSLFGLALLGGTLHVLMDLPTSYGTRLLTPFSTTWFAWDWLPIIDPYLLAILAAGLITLRFNAARWRQTTTAVLVAVLAFYGGRATMHDLAVRRAGGTAAVGQLSAWTSSPRLDKLDPCRATLADRAATGGDTDCGVVALPTFLSPFEWRIIKGVRSGYEVTDVDILGRRPSRSPIFYETASGTTVAGALQNSMARVFLGFARLPVAQVVRGDDQQTVVGFQDLRFIRNLDETIRRGRIRPGPFFVAVRVNPGRVSGSY